MTDRTLPIGRAKKIGIKDIDGKKKLVFEPEFEEITDEGKVIAEMYRQGFMKAFSVGFIPKEAEKISTDGEWPPRYKFIKQELVEISAVPVPALPTATILDGSKTLGLNMSVVKSLLGIKNEEPEEDEDKDKPSEEQPTPTAGEEPVLPDNGDDGSTPTDNAGEQQVTPDSDAGEPTPKEDADKELEETPATEEPKVLSPELQALKKFEAMLKHLIGEVQATRKANKTTNERITELFKQALPKAVEQANQKIKVLEGAR